MSVVKTSMLDLDDGSLLVGYRFSVKRRGLKAVQPRERKVARAKVVGRKAASAKRRG